MAGEPMSATAVALLFTLSRAPIPVREKLEALEKVTEIVLASAEGEDSGLLWAAIETLETAANTLRANAEEWELAQLQSLWEKS